jgi:hypothetical protein
VPVLLNSDPSVTLAMPSAETSASSSPPARLLDQACLGKGRSCLDAKSFHENVASDVPCDVGRVFWILIKKTNYIARLKTARRIY